MIMGLFGCDVKAEKHGVGVVPVRASAIQDKLGGAEKVSTSVISVVCCHKQWRVFLDSLDVFGRFTFLVVLVSTPEIVPA